MSQVSLIFYHTNTTYSKEGKMNKHVWRNNETLNDDSSHRINVRILIKVAVMPILCEKEDRFGIILSLREILN